MASKDTQHFTDANFKAEVLDAEVPVLVDMYATWCGPCRALAPTVERIAAEWHGRIKVGKLDVDENHAIAQRYGIASIPALLLFKGGAVVDGVVGAVPKSQIEKLLVRHIGPAAAA
jgi:thioredoxin 1